ncbi:NAD(P)/FAD-dependent oxidoreductase [Azohydromonas lata]|uniref:FAD-dependent oxidoreductase n=1 Tax=Azohydromonas lata TaxID=45677 RepID=A0ABU5IPE6_9BURK|nr:FAD-dependent oxidoreductase [Azohydromonas lata]MDZ5460765.1 FAD-dependent oxidoreductase [Azohydromonas lata]
MAEDFAGPAGSSTPTPFQTPFDALIVGGGIAGAAIFHRLARSGRRVLLIEKSRFAQGATGWSSGILNCYHACEKLTALACASFSKFMDLERQGGPAVRRSGALHFVSHAQEKVMRERVQEMRGLVPVEWLAADEGARRFPHIRWNDLAGAVFEPTAGHIDPAEVTRFWIAKARAKGQWALEGVEARGVAQDGGHVVGIYSSMGLLRAHRVILCVGAWSRKLAGAGGLALPGNVFSRSVQCDALADTSFAQEHPAFLDPALGIFGRSDSPGMLRAGMALSDWNIDPDSPIPHSPQQQMAVRDVAGQRFQWGGPIRGAGGWRRFDAFTPDGEAVMAADEKISGLYWATGFSGHGFKIAPAVAARMEALAFDGSNGS